MIYLVLPPGGFLYCVCSDPEEIVSLLAEAGLTGGIVQTRRAGPERLSVLRFSRVAMDTPSSTLDTFNKETL